ncbi:MULTISPECIES: hypothetical protein [Pontibacillus]|uniref:Uncharacterized protein n=1 Tax=Pontibacillus chungwhensis TaxID=265426 RepID=A0ABY8V2K7_9BACI|nr:MULTISPECIES: hypothetical protein [Pontibacillus]MCD5324676.1 hypothetical protein [Pontibacillus sp. HN14]WIF99029.1 hypothetical protein QNI29_05075 [Pontibacillus chungwhensis]
MNVFPLFWIVVTLLAFGFNLLGLMRLVPIFISMPLLFIALYFTIFSFTHRRSFRGFK